MTEYIWVALIYGVCAWLIVVTLRHYDQNNAERLLKAVEDAFAMGEASGYRKSAGLPPVHVNGPEPDVDLSAMQETDEETSAGLPEPEPDRVRVNLTGPMVAHQGSQ